MILKNWVGLGIPQFQARNIFDNANVTYVNGNQQDAYRISQIFSALNGNSYANSGGGSVWLDVGYGDTPETFDDIKLSNSNYSDRKLTVLSMTSLSKSSKELINITETVRNDTDNNAIVKEIGYICNPTYQGNLNYCVLLMRKVLDNPVTIAPGESYSFNYIVRLKN